MKILKKRNKINNLEQQIEEAAKNQLKLGKYSSQENAMVCSFLNGALSPEAKACWYNKFIENGKLEENK